MLVVLFTAALLALSSVQRVSEGKKAWLHIQWIYLWVEDHMFLQNDAGREKTSRKAGL